MMAPQSKQQAGLSQQKLHRDESDSLAAEQARGKSPAGVDDPELGVLRYASSFSSLKTDTKRKRESLPSHTNDRSKKVRTSSRERNSRLYQTQDEILLQIRTIGEPAAMTTTQTPSNHNSYYSISGDHDFEPNDGGNNGSDSNDDNNYDHGNDYCEDEKAANRFRLLGFGEEDPSQCDGGDDDDVEWEDVQADVDEAINSALDNEGNNQDSDESDNEEGKKVKNGREKAHQAPKVFFEEVSQVFGNDTDAITNRVYKLEACGYLAILSNLIRTIQKSKFFWDKELIKYDRFLRKIGPENVKTLIIQALEEDLFRIFDPSDVSTKTLRTCNTNKARKYPPARYSQVLS